MIDRNRLLMQLEQTRKEINRQVINPEIKSLSLADIKPIVSMVANARADYVGELFALAAATKGKASPENVTRLHELRVIYDELVAAANALETMIKRGYIDVAGRLDAD
jgi:hypothetical protein